jgi:hypothetical protein
MGPGLRRDDMRKHLDSFARRQMQITSAFGGIADMAGLAVRSRLSRLTHLRHGQSETFSAN